MVISPIVISLIKGGGVWGRSTKVYWYPIMNRCLHKIDFMPQRIPLREVQYEMWRHRAFASPVPTHPSWFPRAASWWATVPMLRAVVQKVGLERYELDSRKKKIIMESLEQRIQLTAQGVNNPVPTIEGIEQAGSRSSISSDCNVTPVCLRRNIWVSESVMQCPIWAWGYKYINEVQICIEDGLVRFKIGGIDVYGFYTKTHGEQNRREISETSQSINKLCQHCFCSTYSIECLQSEMSTS